MKLIKLLTFKLLDLFCFYCMLAINGDSLLYTVKELINR